MRESRDDDRSLRAARRAVADENARLNASPWVEDRLRAEVRSIAAVRRRRTRAASALVAAVFLVAAARPAWRIITNGFAVPHRATSTSSRQTAIPSSRREVTTAFLPLPYSNVPITNGQVVRLEVPRAALASFGLAPVDVLDSAASATVLADVLVGEDGLARAVRFVRVAGRAAESNDGQRATR